MSLNRALAELFKVVREEAASNPDFALKLEEALSVYRPSKALKQAARAKVQPRSPERKPVTEVAGAVIAAQPQPADPERAEPAPIAEPPEAAPAINPVSILSNQGESALRSALAAPSREALAALMAEHNLDPAGQADGAERDGLIEQIVSQAKKRVERDSKLFDY